MRVEEVRGAVQRHRRLARPGAARDNQEPALVGTDCFVLFGLDRRDDVAHPAGAVALQRGEQRALTGDVQALVLGCDLVEHLVVDADDLAALARDEVAAANDAHRRDRGGPVERLRDRRRASR